MCKNVLIIDDERYIAQALIIRLQAAGYVVRWAFDGTSGLAVAADWRPDVIVLDIRMPDIDGFEVNRRLKTRSELADIPVMFLSANVQDSARQTALAAGAHAFLTKPYESRDLLATIRSALVRSSETVDVHSKETKHE